MAVKKLNFSKGGNTYSVPTCETVEEMVRNAQGNTVTKTSELENDSGFMVSINNVRADVNGNIDITEIVKGLIDTALGELSDYGEEEF